MKCKVDMVFWVEGIFVLKCCLVFVSIKKRRLEVYEKFCMCEW